MCPFAVRNVAVAEKQLAEMMNLSWIANVSGKEGDYEEKNRVSSYRGYLLKMRRSHNLLAPQWGKRWFTIEGRFLRWYRQESDISPGGMVDLRYVRSITKVDINGSFTFCVTSEDRNLILRSGSQAEMNNWVRALHIHADIARGGSGMNVVSDFNEMPLKSQGMLCARKSGKLRSSLTLQDELDLNLKKLNDMEIALSLNPAICEVRGNANSKFSTNGTLHEDNNTSRHKTRNPIAYQTDDDEMEEQYTKTSQNRKPPPQLQHQSSSRKNLREEQKQLELIDNESPTSVPPNSSIFRSDSMDSIENISLVGHNSTLPRRRNSHHINNNSSINGNNNSNGNSMNNIAAAVASSSYLIPNNAAVVNTTPLSQRRIIPHDPDFSRSDDDSSAASPRELQYQQHNNNNNEYPRKLPSKNYNKKSHNRQNNGGGRSQQQRNGGRIHNRLGDGSPLGGGGSDLGEISDEFDVSADFEILDHSNDMMDNSILVPLPPASTATTNVSASNDIRSMGKKVVSQHSVNNNNNSNKYNYNTTSKGSVVVGGGPVASAVPSGRHQYQLQQPILRTLSSDSEDNNNNKPYHDKKSLDCNNSNSRHNNKNNGSNNNSGAAAVMRSTSIRAAYPQQNSGSIGNRSNNSSNNNLNDEQQFQHQQGSFKLASSSSASRSSLKSAWTSS